MRGMLTPTDLIGVSVEIVLMMFAFTFISVLLLALEAVGRKGLFRCSVGTLAFASLLLLVNLSGASWVGPKVSYWCALVSAYMVAISAGFTVGEMVAHFADRGAVWDKYSLMTLNFVLVFGFLQAPRSLGEAMANLDSNLELSNLPTVFLLNTPSPKNWKLLRNLDGSFLLVSLAEKKKDLVFRLVKPEEVKEIRSSIAN